MQGTGERFFDTLVEQLVALLGVPRAEVWEVSDRDPSCAAGRRRLGPRSADPAGHGADAPIPGGPGQPPDRDERDVQRACPDNPQVAALGAVGFLGTPAGRFGRPGAGLPGLARRCAPGHVPPAPAGGPAVRPAGGGGDWSAARSMGASPGRTPATTMCWRPLPRVRDPLSGMFNAADVLRETAGADQQARWAAQVMDRQLHYMLGLMDDLGAASELARGNAGTAVRIRGSGTGGPASHRGRPARTGRCAVRT